MSGAAPVVAPLDPGRDRYRQTGYVVLPALLAPEEVDCCRRECERLEADPALWHEVPSAAPRTGKSGEPIYDRIEPVCAVSPVFTALRDDPRLRAMLSGLMGEPVTLFKEKLILKPPGTMGYLAHQDFAYWEALAIPADCLLTLMIAIDRADAANGALELFRAAHHQRLPGTALEPRDVDPLSLRSLEGELACLAPGDAVVFHSLTPHRSGANVSGRYRRAWFSSWTATRFEAARPDLIPTS